MTGGRWRFSEKPDNGPLPGTVRTVELPKDMVVDRFGKTNGRYLFPDGTPYGARSLPPDSVTKGYYRYNPQAVRCRAGDGRRRLWPRGWWNPIFHSRQTVQWLVENRYLRELL